MKQIIIRKNGTKKVKFAREIKACFTPPPQRTAWLRTKENSRRMVLVGVMPCGLVMAATTVKEITASIFRIE